MKCEAEKRLASAAGDEVEQMKLTLALRELDVLEKLERAAWDEVLAESLMARCNVSTLNPGGKRAREANQDEGGRVWGSVKLKVHRDCLNPTCKQRSKKGCSCAACTVGGAQGTLMCKKCFDDDEAHMRAAAARLGGAEGKRARKPMEWLT